MEIFALGCDPRESASVDGRRGVSHDFLSWGSRVNHNDALERELLKESRKASENGDGEVGVGRYD